MKIKKLLSAALALVMTMSLSVSAFAADIETPDDKGVYGGTVEVEGEIKSPTIKVTIPEGGAVIVNPYKMVVNNGSADVQDQIISAPQYIVNGSNVPVSVNVTVTGTVEEGGTVTFATKSAATGTAKSVFLYFEMMATADDQTVPTWATTYDSKAHIVVGTKAVAKTGVLTLTQSDGATPAAAFRLTGDAAANPTTAWTEKDVVNVTLVFSFVPTALAVATGG